MYDNKLYKYLFFTFLLSIVAVLPINAQRYFNSPLSRFNLGTLERQESVRSQGMGGVGVGIRSSQNINEINPASYSAFDSTSFVFDFGMDYRMLKISDGSSNFTSNDLGFHHFKIGFPVSKGIGIALGIAPYSNSYYSLQQSDNSTNTKGNYKHNGEGGLNRVFVGTGVNVIENLSLGVAFNLYYGNIVRENQYTFAESRVNNIRNTETLHTHGFNVDVALQYIYNLSRADQYIVVGAKTSVGNFFKTDYENVLEVYNSSKSTSLTNNDGLSKFAMPLSLDFGASYVISHKLTVGVDYLRTQWSKAKIPGSSGTNTLTDAQSVRAGVEFVPNISNYYNLFSRMEYRAGIHYDNDYLQLDNNKVKGYGVALGLGIPLRRSASRINLYVDYSVRKLNGATVDLSENILTAGFSLNLLEIWFVKSRYE